MNVILIPVEGSLKKVSIKTFSEAKKLVCSFQYDSPAEIIVLSNGNFLLIDEEGKFKNLQINELATEVAHDNQAIYPHDYIVGDALLVEDMDEFDLLPYE